MCSGPHLRACLGWPDWSFFIALLAGGQMTIAAPVSALFSALIPVVFAIFTAGLPSITTLIGFILAFLAVWLISQADGVNLRSLSRIYACL